MYAARVYWSDPVCMFIGSPLRQTADVQGFDNGWWGTILGSPRFLKDYGSCAMVDGVEVCNLTTPQLWREVQSSRLVSVRPQYRMYLTTQWLDA